MRSFEAIYALAEDRHGDALAERVTVVPLSDTALAAIGDDRWLSQMAQRIFSAGFVWRVVEAKWPGFEAAFDGFEPRVVAAYDADKLAALGADARIIRNPQKIQATVANAAFVRDTAADHGSFGAWVAGWPDDDVIGLWEALAKGGARLGGQTGPMLLRFMGKDSFVLSKDVVSRLVAEGVVHKAPTSKRDLRAVQQAFARWKQESGLSYGTVSRVLACSIDA